VDRERWAALARRRKEEAELQPRRYRGRVRRFLLLGSVVVVGWLLSLLALVAAVVYLSLADGQVVLGIRALFFMGPFFFIAFSSLVVAIPEPDGIAATREDAPALFETIDAVDARVQGPPLAGVRIDGQLNAGVVGVPGRLAGLGARNYLVVGLPLLQALTADEFRAVLAHELAHLSRRHGRLSRSLYRREAAWQQFHDALRKRAAVTRVVLGAFFAWYLPRLHAYALPLLHRHEHEADAIAAEAEGVERMARALMRLALAERYLEWRFWPDVAARARDEPSPPRTVFAELGARVRAAATDPAVAVWLRTSLREDEDPTESHPSLERRLAALGAAAPEVVESAEPSAAATLLEPRLDDLCTRLGIRWQRDVLADWRRQHEHARRARAERAVLQQRVDSLDVDERYRFADLTEDVGERTEAIALMRQLLADAPGYQPAQFALGRMLLAEGDDAGLRELERAIDLDPESTIPACLMIVDFLSSRDRDEETAPYVERLQRHLETLG
jgi:Zn-dependent protease with chaperone function